MAINPTPVFQAIEQHIKSTTDCAVHLSKIPEDESLTYDEDTGLVEPFICVIIGTILRACISRWIVILDDIGIHNFLRVTCLRC